MLIGRPRDIKSSEITPRAVYLNRRDLLVGAAAAGATGLIADEAFAAKLEAAKSPLSSKIRCLRADLLPPH